MKLRGPLTSLICALFAVVVMTAAASTCCGHANGGALHSVVEGSGHQGDDTSRHPAKSHAKQACATLCCAPLTACVRIGSGVTGEAPRTPGVPDAGAGALSSPSSPPPRPV